MFRIMSCFKKVSIDARKVMLRVEGPLSTKWDDDVRSRRTNTVSETRRERSVRPWSRSNPVPFTGPSAGWNLNSSRVCLGTLRGARNAARGRRALVISV
ncbi:hypothetical protein EVAR_63677_1 [Eumeta japonica]|uniref:Uncharacterized protein n=1 Tax=Eumeta variegata TaxID=151549 RepID=A0A4C1ZS33_EUMVA|nr:hypothetical protein EVAR_63677_1 [Eumeta japonica]